MNNIQVLTKIATGQSYRKIAKEFDTTTSVIKSIHKNVLTFHSPGRGHGRAYPQDLKEATLNAVKSTTLKYNQIAENLDIHPKNVSMWALDAGLVKRKTKARTEQEVISEYELEITRLQGQLQDIMDSLGKLASKI